MPHMTIHEIIEHGCNGCDFFQSCSSWCLRFSCVGAATGTTKRNASAGKPRFKDEALRLSTRSSLTAEDEMRRRELHAAGKSDNEIAEIVGVKPSAISSWRASRNLEANAPPRWRLTKDEKERRMQAYLDFGNDSAAADAVGISRSTFQKWRAYNGLPLKTAKN